MDRMEDKFVFFLLNLGAVVRLILSLVFFQAIFTKVDAIAGWSFAEVIVLLGTWEFIHSIAWATYFRGGFRRIPVYLQRGDLDILLTRPLNLKTYFIYDNNDLLFSLPTILLAVCLIIYGFSISATDLNILNYLLLLIIGIVIHYSLVVMMSSINFWTIIEQFTYLFSEVADLGRYPITIYKGFTRLALTIVIPVACIYSFPAKALFGNLKISELGAMFGVLIIFLFCSNFIWNRGLRRYESTGF